MYEIKIDDTGLDSILECIDAKHEDVILYLGGRVDDSNLYPDKYCKYLNSKIKELNPKKIICHTHWYADKYYERGILDESRKIDMILCHFDYMANDTFQPLNAQDYGGSHRFYLQKIMNNNPNIVIANYLNNLGSWYWNRVVGFELPESIMFNTSWCPETFNLNNIKYFTFERGYCPIDLVGKDLGHGNDIRNSTDGFDIIKQIIGLGYKNLNITGFTAFGSEEDCSIFSNYNVKDKKVNGKNYFNIETSEDQRAEADILKYWADNKTIYNLEDHDKLNYCLGEAND